MQVIYKYFIEASKEQDSPIFYYCVKLPKGANVISTIDISVDPDLEGIVYAIVDPEEQEMVERKIILYGTGWPVRDEDIISILRNEYQFLGTFRDLNNCIWHLWIEQEKTDIAEVFRKLLC